MRCTRQEECTWKQRYVIYLLTVQTNNKKGKLTEPPSDILHQGVDGSDDIFVVNIVGEVDVITI